MVESTQHILDRVRSPRVQITYDVEIGNAIVMKELPFVLGVLADLSGMPADPLPKLKLRKFIEIDRDNFSDVFASINPRLILQVKNMLVNGGDPLNMEIFFKNIDDFGPLSLAKRVPQLSGIYNSRVKLTDLIAKFEGNDPVQNLVKAIVADADLKLKLRQQIDAFMKTTKQVVTADFATTTSGGESPANVVPVTPVIDATPAQSARDILKELFVDGKMAREAEQESIACILLTELLNYIDADKLESLKLPLAYVESKVAAIDKMLTAQINEILHATAFQELEGTWRALRFLIMNTETSTQLKIRLMNASKKDLLDDLENAIEFDQSGLFKKIYEEEYGTFGGHPYSCLIGGYEFSRNPQEIELLNKISNVAAAAHAPFIAAAHPRLFDLDSFTHLGEPRDLAKVFESTELVKWHSFRDNEDSRYVALVLPRVLMRLPYGPDTLPVDGLNFVENVTGVDNSQFCWGNAAFVYAQKIAYAVSLYKWPASIRGVEGGGLVEDLPAYTFKTTDGDIALKCPTEIAITDRREKELSDMGFLAVCHSKGTDFAAFFGGQTTHKPLVYNTDFANSNANLSARLPYLLCASRFAHYIKVIMRDKIGSFLTKDNVSMYLNNWIANYVLLNDNASQTLKAKFPLREARIDVYDVPGNPGFYKSIIYLRPHFQLEGLTASIRLVASLPPPAAG